jgi:hypothetical protein
MGGISMAKINRKFIDFYSFKLEMYKEEGLIIGREEDSELIYENLPEIINVIVNGMMEGTLPNDVTFLFDNFKVSITFEEEGDDE